MSELYSFSTYCVKAPVPVYHVNLQKIGRDKEICDAIKRYYFIYACPFDL